MTDKEKTASMNILDFFMLGFGSIVGVGWCVAVNGWFASGGGPAATFLAFLIGTILLIPIGFCYAELTSAMPVAGGAVAVTYKTFGKFPSFVAGWFIALAFISILPWEAIYINTVLALLFPVLKTGTPLYSVAGTGIYAYGLVLGVIISLVIIYINHIGSRVAAKAQTYMTALLAIVGVLVIIFAFAKADPANLMPIYQNIGKGSHSSFFGAFVAMFAIVPFFMAGFDTIPQGAEEGGSKINLNNLSKVMVGSILAAGGFYCLIILSTGLAMPWQDFTALKRPAISLLFVKLYGDGALGIALYWLAMLGALAGLLTTWNGLYIASARLLLGMSRARLIPEYFSTIHPRYGTPYGANCLCAVASLAGPFIGIGIIDPLTTAGGTAFVISWFVVSLCAIKLRYSAPDMPRPYRMPGGLTTAWIGTIASAAIAISTFIPGLPAYMEDLGIYIFIGWAILGLIFYYGSSGYRNAISEEERVASLFQARR